MYPSKEGEYLMEGEIAMIFPHLNGKARFYTYREACISSGEIRMDATAEDIGIFWDLVKDQITEVVSCGKVRPVEEHYKMGIPKYWDNKSLVYFPEDRIAILHWDGDLYIGTSIEVNH